MRFQQGGEFGEQISWGLVAWLAVRVLATGSLLSFSMFTVKDVSGCTGTDW